MDLNGPARSYDEAFAELIACPLRQIVGKRLMAVNYYALGSDVLSCGFDAETPNHHGCQGIHLVFDGAEAEFDWGWESALGGSYHIMVSDHSVRVDAVQSLADDDAGGLICIDASDTEIWRSVVRRALDNFDVLGCRSDTFRMSPQAVRLRFGDASIVLAIGISGNAPSYAPHLGSGDEVLVFRDVEWRQLPSEVCSHLELMLLET